MNVSFVWPFSYLLIFWIISGAGSFHVGSDCSFLGKSFPTVSGSRVAASSSSLDKTTAEGPVDKNTFLEAYKMLQESIAAGLVGEAPPPSSSSLMFDDYVIGRVQVDLCLFPDPGLNLAETANGMTLVSEVSGNAKEAGIRVGDTIVQVRGGLMAVNTKQLSLEQTGSYLMQAAEKASREGNDSVGLTLNRLIKIKFQE